MPFLAVQNHTIFDFGRKTEKRVVREIRLRFFICQTSHVAIEDVAKGPCRYFSIVFSFP